MQSLITTSENQRFFRFFTQAAGPSQQMPASQHCSVLAPENDPQHEFEKPSDDFAGAACNFTCNKSR